ncbi:MAG: glycosyltransferase [Planctomycetota bacterium]
MSDAPVPPPMHCQDELDRDLAYEGLLPDAVLLRWHADRYSTSKHLLVLYSLARGLDARRIVEVGFGRSTFVLARAAAENGGRLASCDLVDFGPLLSPLERRVTDLHHGAVETFWPRIAPGVDFAFLDCFSAEGLDPAWVQAQLCECLARMRPGGVLAVHDAAVRAYRLGEVLERLRGVVDVATGRPFEQLTLDHNYGLALLRRPVAPGTAVADPFVKKAAATPQLPPVLAGAGEPRATAAAKPRVLLIADVPDWIFARHCRELSARLGDEFEFTTRCQGEPFDEDAFDLVYPLEWNLVDGREIRDPGKYVTGVRSFTAWRDRAPQEFGACLRRRFGRVHAVSRRLVEVLREAVPGIVHLSHGVDLERFRPTTRADRSGEQLVLGWCGNRNATVKGSAAWIEPLGGLPGVRLVQCGYRDGQRDPADMPAFYDSIDAYVCASASEGNNNAVLEAAAMGRAIVTTDSGSVAEWLRDGDSALIVEPELPQLVAAVEHLRDHPRLRRRLGERARAAVQPFDWRVQALAHARFLRAALAQRPVATPSTVVQPQEQLARVRQELQRGRVREAILLLDAARREHPGSAVLDRAAAELQRLVAR